MAIKRGLLATIAFLLVGVVIAYMIGSMADELVDVHIFALIWLIAAVFGGGVVCGYHSKAQEMHKKSLKQGLILAAIAVGLLVWFVPLLLDFWLILYLVAGALLLSFWGGWLGVNVAKAQKIITKELKEKEKNIDDNDE